MISKFLYIRIAYPVYKYTLLRLSLDRISITLIIKSLSKFKYFDRLKLSYVNATNIKPRYPIAKTGMYEHI